MEDILDENLSKELEFVRLKKRWKAKEAELRAEREQQFGMDEGEECDDQGVTLKRQPKQVFRYILTNIRLLIRFYYWYLMTNLIRWLIKISLSDKLSYLNLNKYSHHNSTNAASGILINDIIAIMESSANIGITVNPIEDNIFQWQVLLKDFNGKLAEDLNFVNGSYDYDYIELQLDFSMVRNYSHMIFFL